MGLLNEHSFPVVFEGEVPVRIIWPILGLHDLVALRILFIRGDLIEWHIVASLGVKQTVTLLPLFLSNLSFKVVLEEFVLFFLFFGLTLAFIFWVKEHWLGHVFIATSW